MKDKTKRTDVHILKMLDHRPMSYCYIICYIMAYAQTTYCSRSCSARMHFRIQVEFVETDKFYITCALLLLRIYLHVSTGSDVYVMGLASTIG